MYLCYIDESGTPQLPGNTSHFILAGLTLPIWHWKTCETEINLIRRRYNLESAEIHVAWILRSYQEQSKVPDFERMNYFQRRYEVDKLRKATILRLQASPNKKLYKQTKKSFEKTQPYIHLTRKERASFIEDLAKTVGDWGFARLFGECIDKIHFDPLRAPKSLDEQALEQIVTRFEFFLKNKERDQGERKPYGILIHDNNETSAKRHTELMKSFHRTGTFWTQLDHIIETPLFVSSELTSMVQIADLCAYALRRYLENGETTLLTHLFKRADRKGDVVVGVRHFTASNCSCMICASHRMPST
ncbi:MAG: DUF3800 domain-containing protein [Thermodesulfobacteriota bacterium]